MLQGIPGRVYRAACGGDRVALEQLTDLVVAGAPRLLAALLAAGEPREIALDRIASAVRQTVRLPQFAWTAHGDVVDGLLLARFLIEVGRIALPAAHDDAGDREEGAQGRARDVPDEIAGAVAARPARDAVLGTGTAADALAPPLSVLIDLQWMSDDQAVAFLVGLSDLYRVAGGDGLVVRAIGALEPALLPAAV